MKRRIYISRDFGAGAWLQAAVDYGKTKRDQQPPTVEEVGKWGRGQADCWSQPGTLYRLPLDGRLWYICGFPDDPAILIRAWHHLFPLMGVQPQLWELINVSVSAPRIKSWTQFLRNYDRLVRGRESG